MGSTNRVTNRESRVRYFFVQLMQIFNDRENTNVVSN